MIGSDDNFPDKLKALQSRVTKLVQRGTPHVNPDEALSSILAGEKPQKLRQGGLYVVVKKNDGGQHDLFYETHFSVGERKIDLASLDKINSARLTPLVEAIIRASVKNLEIRIEQLNNGKISVNRLEEEIQGLESSSDKTRDSEASHSTRAKNLERDDQPKFANADIIWQYALQNIAASKKEKKIAHIAENVQSLINKLQKTIEARYSHFKEEKRAAYDACVNKALSAMENFLLYLEECQLCKKGNLELKSIGKFPHAQLMDSFEDSLRFLDDFGTWTALYQDHKLTAATEGFTYLDRLITGMTTYDRATRDISEPHASARVILPETIKKAQETLAEEAKSVDTTFQTSEIGKQRGFKALFSWFADYLPAWFSYSNAQYKMAEAVNYVKDKAVIGIGVTTAYLKSGAKIGAAFGQSTLEVKKAEKNKSFAGDITHETNSTATGHRQHSL